MIRRHRFSGAVVLAGVVALLSWLAATSMAQTRAAYPSRSANAYAANGYANVRPATAYAANGQAVAGQPVNGQPFNGQPVNGQPVVGPYPPQPNMGPCPMACPRVPPFAGHYQTGWRDWPGVTTLGRENPLAPGKEVLPTPPGREILPLPRATQKQQELPQPQGQPEGQLPDQGGSILPPLEGAIVPPEQMILPPKSGTDVVPSAPGSEGLLPGIPDETEKPGPAGKSPTGQSTDKPSNGAAKDQPSEKPAGSLPGTLPGLGEPALPSEKDSGKPVAPKAEPKSQSNENLPLRGVEGPKPAFADSDAPIRPSLASPSFEVKPKVTAWNAPVKREPARPAVSLNDLPPAAAIATPPVSRNAPICDTVISLGAKIEPERTALMSGAYTADSIAVAPADRNRVNQTSYIAPELPGKAFVDASGNPSVALNGYCPVELSQNGQWVAGDLRWTVIHEGRIYRLSGVEQWRQFSAKPEAYAPVQAGADVVIAQKEHRTEAGQPTYCATYNGRLYMFSSAETQAEFNKNPQSYAGK